MTENGTGNGAKEDQKAAEQAYAFVIEQIKQGAGIPEIAQKLEEAGVEKVEAGELAEKMYHQVMEAAKEEQVEQGAIIAGAVGGLAAALVGGIVWGLIIIFANYELGIIAWGIGLVAGYAVVIFSRGKRGTPLQVIAVISSVLGIILGKYISFYHFLKLSVEEEHGVEAAKEVLILSAQVLQLFIENITLMVGGFDILWVVLAVYTAWRIPRGLGIKV